MSMENMSKKALAEKLTHYGVHISQNGLKKWTRVQLVERLQQLKRDAENAEINPRQKLIGRYNPEAVIHVLVEGNPKKSGTWAFIMFDMLRSCNGKTVREYDAMVREATKLPKGYRAAGEIDLALKRGWISLQQPETANDNLEVGESLQPCIGTSLWDAAE